MASHPARTPLGLFDNPVRVFSLDELAETVRKLERERPGRTVQELSGAVFTELAIKRTRRAADLVAEAIRLARPRQPGTEITGSQWQASTSEVRNWALSAGFELGADGTIPGPAITAYNQVQRPRGWLTGSLTGLSPGLRACLGVPVRKLTRRAGQGGVASPALSRSPRPPAAAPARPGPAPAR